jgi:hypothetical protein
VAEAELFGAVMCVGFGFPSNLRPLWSSIVAGNKWACFFAELDGEPVGAGAMYINGKYAWLGGGNTLPEFRNRGAQKALINARLNEGVSRGVKTFAVETENPSAEKANISFKNLISAGFLCTFSRKNYALPEMLK